ncbi:hypothetical protein SAMN05421858_4321 [Haladaptatus litoreus]|uniref:Uncharacterized protein n=1 Tax=Haladaptatus litoreus TaxID=553468 RepID=A0A1N7EJY2_9EURY|nr:hypothetical protein SAMN05421858_4321 [Haladaptatus litoreus]
MRIPTTNSNDVTQLRAYEDHALNGFFAIFEKVISLVSVIQSRSDRSSVRIQIIRYALGFLLVRD